MPEKSSAISDLLQGINDALAFAKKLVDLDGLYTRQQPVIKARLEGMQKHDHVYLAHEYFNKNWDTISFARMAELLAPAKMDFMSARPITSSLSIF